MANGFSKGFSFGFEVMAGFLPDEGENLLRDMVLKRTLTDRDANLELGLFTNSSVDETITEATITEPTGGGYARKTLTDAGWSSANPSTYAEQTFTASGDMTGSVYGYFIATIAAGGTQRLIAVEVDSAGPYTLTDGSTYSITPSITLV